jgi:ribonuclease-3
LSRASAAELAEALADTFGHRFRQPELLREALTHPSASPPAAKSARVRPSRQRGYERLEFLGDRVLGLVVADLLYAAYPQEDEGALAKRLAHGEARATGSPASPPPPPSATIWCSPRPNRSPAAAATRPSWPTPARP